MFKKHLLFTGIILAVLLTSCAKRGSITGGLKDTLAPVLKNSYPKNYSTEFKEKSFKLTFDEYIKLKNINKQLIVSPPMKKAPEVLPTTASKYITVKINDTLQPNTTYSFNFGESIEDNNEGNPYKQFKYVFSTGTYIDSLTLSGKIKDAYSKKTDNYVSVMLYDVNDNYNDSIVYKQNPRYITNTLDSSTTFQLENLKAGKYLLVALKDENSNYKFDPKAEKIAFQKTYITVPNDTLYELELFKEMAKFSAIKPTQNSGNRLLMGYEGNPKNTKVTLKHGTENLDVIISKFQGKDSLQIWHKPIKVDNASKIDSLQFSISNGDYTKDFSVRIKNQKTDTLSFNPKFKGDLPLREKFTITSGVPLTVFDNAKMQLTNKDSIAVTFKTEYDEMNQELKLDFAKEPLEKYKLVLLPGALTDYMGNANDSLVYKISTRNISDYGNLRLTLENVKSYPIIVELTNEKGDVLASAYSENDPKISFDLLEPAKFTLRVIYDTNNNKEWDPGNFLEKRQSEEVIYFPKEIDVRANWDVEQSVNLKP